MAEPPVREPRRRARRSLAAAVCAALTATFTVFLGQVPSSAEEVMPEAFSQFARPGSGFDPGNIIADAQFYDTASMTPQQVRDFLRDEGAGCTGSWCLKNLTLTTPDQPADRYCAAYQGGADEDAAAVLVKISVACGINPQVMLVTVQKESALLTRTAVTESSYDAAWGWHCPDTGPGGTANCDPAYAGFFNQAYGMAKQWSRYRVDPEKYTYRAGQTVNILWNVAESGCGSSPVTITNTATASLYNYTPYQPNAASLTAYPGVGDACSSYGNRNFHNLFHWYFGTAAGSPTTAPTASPVLTIPDHGDVPTALVGQSITAPTPAVAAGLAAGFAALGMPYVWGGGGSGAGPNNGCARGGGDFNSCGTQTGFDCSGLTAFVLGQAGYRIPDNSGAQRTSGVPVPWDQALPGDIVGFPGHVAVYLGNFGGKPYILEASWVGTPIHITPLTRPGVDAQLYRYWTGPVVTPPGFADFSRINQQRPGAASNPTRPPAADNVTNTPPTAAAWRPPHNPDRPVTAHQAPDPHPVPPTPTANPWAPPRTTPTNNPAPPAEPVPNAARQPHRPNQHRPCHSPPPPQPPRLQLPHSYPHPWHRRTHHRPTSPQPATALRSANPRPRPRSPRPPRPTPRWTHRLHQPPSRPRNPVSPSRPNPPPTSRRIATSKPRSRRAHRNDQQQSPASATRPTTRHQHPSPSPRPSNRQHPPPKTTPQQKRPTPPPEVQTAPPRHRDRPRPHRNPSLPSSSETPHWPPLP
jgi:cell wall-associated NlpC family hydrolase